MPHPALSPTLLPLSPTENTQKATSALQADHLQSTAQWAIEELFTCTNINPECNLECTAVKIKPNTNKVLISFRWIADTHLTDPDTNGWQPQYEEDYGVFDYTHPHFEEQMYEYLEQTINTRL